MLNARIKFTAQAARIAPLEVTRAENARIPSRTQLDIYLT